VVDALFASKKAKASFSEINLSTSLKERLIAAKFRRKSCAERQKFASLEGRDSYAKARQEPANASKFFLPS